LDGQLFDRSGSASRFDLRGRAGSFGRSFGGSVGRGGAAAGRGSSPMSQEQEDDDVAGLFSRYRERPSMSPSSDRKSAVAIAIRTSTMFWKCGAGVNGWVQGWGWDTVYPTGQGLR
jgi:hypothetical protein